MVIAKVPLGAWLRGAFAVLILTAAACGNDSPPSPDGETGAANTRGAGVAEADDGNLDDGNLNGALELPAAAPTEPVTPEFAAPSGAVLSDEWYESLNDGRKNGWYHMVWTRSSVDGRPSIHDRTEHVTASTRVMGETEDVFRSRDVSDLERTDDGLLLSLRSVSVIDRRAEVTTIRFTGDAYEWTVKVADLTQTKRVPTPTALPVDTEAFLAPFARRGELTEGKRLTYSVANYQAERLDTVELVVEGEDEIPTPAGRVTCRRIKERVLNRPGESTWWIDARGVLCRLKQGTMRIDRTTPERAKRLDPSAAAYTITIAADPPIARSTTFDTSTVEVAIRRSPDLELPDFPKTPFSHEVSRDGDRITMLLTSHDDPKANCAFPVTDKALEKWLESTNLYTPQHPTVERAMGEALGNVDKNDAREATRKILRYVFLKLRKASGPIPQPTAVEILGASMGDCSEHAVLFVALCRSAGIPARRATGYAQVGDMWGAHSFCEVWLGKWVGADPTTNELGTAARYLCFGWDEDPDSYPGLVSSRVQGRMSIRTVAFTEHGESVDVETAVRASNRVGRATGNGVLDGYRTAPLPEGWTTEFESEGHAMTLRGPGTQVQVRCMWGMGDISASMLREGRMSSGIDTTFAGVAALRASSRTMRSGGASATYTLPARRRLYFVSVQTRDDAPADAVSTAESLLAPTFN